jgi:hypothetical protein
MQKLLSILIDEGIVEKCTVILFDGIHVSVK